ncbi:MAG: VOC family protein [Bacteroidetes bacterium]|nr:VOC family protein [Bacteroidota bacterium]MCW5896472.1 VOC family protein [Bacteroidota bacterium]
MQESLSFYTNILGFSLKEPGFGTESPVINLVNGEAEIQLSVLAGDSEFGCDVNVIVDDVDALFAGFVSRGLDTSAKPESPVHQGPVNQAWGMREFYVDDPNGNTLRFAVPIRRSA